MTVTLKFFGFIFLFAMAEAFTQNYSDKLTNKKGIDSIKFWKEGMKDCQIFIEARIRIYDKKMQLLDSLKAFNSCVIKDTLYARTKQ